MFLLYFIYKTTPNLNIKNKVLTHMSLLATIILYIIDNVSKRQENMRNNKNYKHIRRRKRNKPKPVILKKKINFDSSTEFNKFNNLDQDYLNIPDY
tara:strand:- start:201 stop:488 length:288 start_codon:yes stop_codon:yes gene_type:complete